MFSKVSIDNFVKYGSFNNFHHVISESRDSYIYPHDENSKHYAEIYGYINDTFVTFDVSYTKPECNHIHVNFETDSYVVDNFHCGCCYSAIFMFIKKNYNAYDFILGYRIDNLGTNLHYISGVKYKQIPCFDIIATGGKYCNLVYKS